MPDGILPYNSVLIIIMIYPYRLELAYKDTLRKKPIFDEVNNLLKGLYIFYNKRPLMRSMLKRSFKAEGKTILLPTRVGGTRWLPQTKRALTNFLHSYGVIATHLSQVSIQNTLNVNII